MSEPVQNSWNPTAYKRFVKCWPTSTGAARIITDAGEGVIKPLGNNVGPHALVRELIAARLAQWFGLPTFEFAVFTVQGDDEIELGHGRQAEQGPAFITKYHHGHTWGGSEDELKAVENCDIITKLVVFDTLILNVDRYPPDGMGRRPNYDNVFLSEVGADPGRFRLVAMDHTHCLGAPDDLSKRLANIGNTKDKRVYGLFPAFQEHVRQCHLDVAMQRLSNLSEDDVQSITDGIPAAWQVATEALVAVRELLVRRACFLVETLPGKLAMYNMEQGKLDI